jgi:hypothetical protein
LEDVLTLGSSLNPISEKAHACNPSYSGCRDQEDHESNQPGQIVLETLSRKTLHKKGLVEWLKV